MRSSFIARQSREAGDRVSAKVLGNGLRELDRFLSILLDEIAFAAGWCDADLRMIAAMRHTSLKLRMVNARSGADVAGVGRLLALSRCRDMLMHCDGVVRRGDGRAVTTLTLGWPSDAQHGAAAILRYGERMIVGPAQLGSVCAFYERLGDRLVGLPSGAAPRVASATGIS